MEKQLTVLIQQLNQTASQLAKLIKRADIELAIGLKPGHTVRFSIRLGDQPWVKNIDLAPTLDLLTQPAEYRRKLAAEILRQKERAETIAELTLAIDRWQNGVSIKDPPL